MCILLASAAADRCGGGVCEGNGPEGRSLLQTDAASSLKQDYGTVNDDRDMAAETDDHERKSLTKTLDIDVKMMEGEFAKMNEKMKVIENTLGVTTASATSDATTEDKTEEASLQQTASEPNDSSLRARISTLETNVADLLSRTISVETDVGVAHTSLLDATTDPVIGLANRAIALHLKVHDLQGRIAKMEHEVVNGLKPDATLMEKEVDILDHKVNALKMNVQGPDSLLEVGASSEKGLKSQVSDLETRVGELLSTTAALETELHGPSNEPVTGEALLQEEKTNGNQGLAARMSALKEKVSNLKSRVFTLEHHVNGLVTGLYVEKK